MTDTRPGVRTIWLRATESGRFVGLRRLQPFAINAQQRFAPDFARGGRPWDNGCWPSNHHGTPTIKVRATQTVRNEVAQSLRAAMTACGWEVEVIW